MLIFIYWIAATFYHISLKMPDLFNALDNYKDITHNGYFVLCYNKFPSYLSFETTIKETKENMDSVMKAIDFEKLKLGVVYKNWTSEDNKDSDSSQDYPYQYLFKSESKSLLLWLSLSGGNLLMDVFYDAADVELEQEVILLNQSLRKQFGIIKTPTFKVLTCESGTFDLTSVNNEFLKVNIEELYNEDFHEINAIIEQSLVEEKSGLILLHGAPGTGKTSYIKSLISRFQESRFIFVQNEFVQDLLKPDFISFLIKYRNSILIIEDAEKVITSRENLNESSVVSTILQLTDGLFSDYLNIKIICTFNTNINRIDKALLRKGRLIANYEFKPLTKEKSNKLLASLGHDISNTDMSLADIFNLEKKAFDTGDNKAKIGFF